MQPEQVGDKTQATGEKGYIGRDCRYTDAFARSCEHRRAPVPASTGISDGTGGFAKAYQIALKSEKNSILAESTMVEVIRKFSGYLYHPSSFELLGCIYILEQDVKGQAHMSVSFKYRALNKSGIDKSIGWQEVWPVKCGDVDILPVKFHEDENGRGYNYDMECASEGKFNCTKMTKGQLTRINKRVANETLGNISPVPAEMIDCSLIPESEFKSIITGYKSNGTD